LKHLVAAIVLLAMSRQGLLAEEEARTLPETVLTVEVVNGTTDGTAVTGDAVVVDLYERHEPLRTLEGKVAADGKVVFENVPTGDEMVAFPGSRHGGMMFSGPPVALKPTKDEYSTQVQVFDTSTDRSSLSVQTHHLFVKNTPAALVFTEYMQLVNSSTMAVSSKQQDAQGRAIVLEIKLPQGFKNLESLGYFEEDAIILTDSGFYDTMAVPPGQYQAMFTYAIEKSSDSIDIVKGITLPTSRLMVFSGLGQASIQGLGRPGSQAMAPGEAEIRYYTRDNLSAGQEVAFNITGLSVEAPGAGMWVVLAVVLGAVMVLVVFRLCSNKG